MIGTIIGKQGRKIKQLQDSTSTLITAYKEHLPQSTERILEINGCKDSVCNAIFEIAKSMVVDWRCN